MGQIVSVGPTEIELLDPPEVKVNDTDFSEIAKSNAGRIVEGIASAGLGKIAVGDIIVADDGTVVLANQELYDKIKARLDSGDMVIFGNAPCLNIVCFTF